MSTACGRCDATWTGKRIEHCTVCHETFTGTGAGDKHRTGSHWPDERRCLTPDEMRAKGMRQNARGQWGLGGVSPWAEGAESAEASSLRTPDSPTPTWTGLYGIDPGFTGGLPIDEFLEQNRGDA